MAKSKVPDLVPKTASEALARWDAGGSVFTLEMGGLGPGYEQVIHIVVFELIRAFKDVRIDWAADPAILNHLREAGLHARGCWVIDIVLGKE